ncbi:MAG TPA: hypothetical protein PKD00_00430 [Burkholderiales bacterium]|nr:hypothetical protein [Burkholderiales bacterium]
MTYSEIVSRVQIALGKGVPSASNRLSDRHIISLVKAKKPLAKRQLRLEIAELNTLLALNCFPLVKASEVDCQCLNLVTCDTVMKSVYKLPSYIGAIQVMTIDGGKNISLVERSTKEYSLNHSRFGQTSPKAYVLNDYLYLINAEYKAVTVIADFEDEEEVEKLNMKCITSVNERCLSAMELNMTGETIVIDRAITLAVTELIKAWQSGSEDNTNNAKSNDASREQEN